MNSEFFKSVLAQDEALFITSAENILYLTGFASSDGYMLITKQECILLVDSRYIEAAREQAENCTQIILLSSIGKQLCELCEKYGVAVLYPETQRITLSQFRTVCDILPTVQVSEDDKADRIINGMRESKTEKELGCICAAQRIAEKAFEHILGFIKEGVSEREVALELDYFMLKNGAEAVSFETIAVSGANSSKPHGVPSEKRIEKGDFITLDFGAVVKGYHSDMTRTVALGFVNDEQAKVYETVLKAQENALGALYAGADCSEVDAAARDYITANGYGECFGHSTGHGVGVEIHELPTLSRRGGGISLPEGAVVTVEPGIYLPGKFGVRIEDMAFITRDGYVNLTKSPKNLIILN